MANKTVKLTSYVFNGRTGLTLLLLHPETGAIGNGAGDALTAGANGLFTATVTEAITGYWRIVVLDGSVPLIENEWIRFKTDVEGIYVAGDPKDMADNVYLLPTKGTPNDNRPTTSTVYASTNESFLVVRTVTDTAKALVDLSGRTLRFICEAASGLDKTVIEAADITISGTGDATYSLKIPKTVMAKARTLSCVLRDVTDTDDNNKLDSFELVVKYAPDAG
jgi:hypothetical protein